MDYQKGGYGNGGWKKYLWIYIIVAVVVYGGIYYYYTHKNNSSTGQTNSIY